jgi:hypothetical protein
MLLVSMPSRRKGVTGDVEAAAGISTSLGGRLFEGAMPVKFMILIHSNPRSREIWESFTQAQRAEGIAYYAALTDDLVRSGELIATEALAPPSEGRRAGDAAMATDGPFAEVKEHLAGFFLVECASFERAMKIASRVPEAELGLVEVRPVIDAASLLA